MSLARTRAVAPGLAVSLLAAKFLSEHYTASVMLFALFLGLRFNFPIETNRIGIGIEFAAKTL